MPTQSYFQTIEGSEEKRIIPVKRGVQCSELQIRDLVLNICFLSGKPGRGSLTTFYQPETGLFGWHYGRFIDISQPVKLSGRLDTFLDRFYVYRSNTRMVVFVFPPFSFKEFKERYDTFEEAYDKLIAHLETQLDVIEAGNSDYWYQNISLSLRSGFDYKYFRNYEGMRAVHNPRLRTVARITQVNYQDGEWKVELKNQVNGRESTFILNEQMECVRYWGSDD
jgi:hypothetical protein